MLSFDFVRAAERPPVINAGAIFLRTPGPGDYAAWANLREQSREHLTRWEPAWKSAEAAAEAFRLRLKSYERQFRARAGVAFHVFRRGDGALVGGVTLSDVRRHAAQSATVGYWIGEAFLRQGYGLAAVAGAVGYAFEGLGLNRVEAACQPGNAPSRALLAKAGFVEEGLAREYLFINGAWRDHVLFARLARDHAGGGDAPAS
ncbi:MAG: GNAT family N-acetyltransferase [Parvularculaceae bacterium]